MPFQARTGLRKRLRDGDLTIGLIVRVTGGESIEAAAYNGMDFAVLDAKHASFDLMDVRDAARTADAVGLPLLVRPQSADPDTIARIMDGGALGVVVPHVRGAADAARAVAAVKYAPEGARSVCSNSRAARYAGGPGWDDYRRTANAETVIVVLVEDPEGIEHLDAIAAVPGIDALWVGTADLAQALGVARDDRRVHDATAAALAAARRHGIAPYVQLLGRGSVAGMRDLYREGFRAFSWTDMTVLMEAVGELTTAARDAVRG